MSRLLTNYLAKVVEMRWSEFLELESSQQYSAYEGVVLGVVRACTKGNKKAITTALDRLDGKIAETFDIRLPKLRYRFVNAKGIVGGAKPALPPSDATEDDEEIGDVGAGDLPSGKLRPALEKMLREPMGVVNSIIKTAKHIDETGSTLKGDPSVKGVIVAHLVKAAVSSKHSMGYASEVLDQIDGKVATPINIAGGDININRYEEYAPEGAYLDENGVYTLELPMATQVWGARIVDLHKSGRLRG